jgi:plastocyanin
LDKVLSVRRLILLVGLLNAIGCAGEAQPPPGPSASQPAVSGNAVVSGQAPAGAIVSFESASGEPPLPEGPVVMDQYSRNFVPDLLFVRVGQLVEFRNSEDVDHNIRVLRNPTGTTVMDVSGSQNQVFTHTFQQPGSYDVSCDVHPGMRATIVASRTPYITAVNERGRFTLNDVPPGRYTMRVASGGRETSESVEVAAPKTELTRSGR